MPDYNYAEECEEPAAARIDMHALKNQLADPTKLRGRISVDAFNKSLSAKARGKRDRHSPGRK